MRSKTNLEIMSMSPVESRIYHQKLITKRIMTRTTIMIATVTVIHVGAALLEKHLDKKSKQSEEN